MTRTIAPLVAVLVLVSASPIPAQRPAWPAPPARFIAPAGEAQDSQPARKSAALAGTLSFLLPGTGSFYAGHTAHGLRHLIAVPVIVGLTVGATYVGVFSESSDLDAGDFTPLFIGAGLLLANGVWGIVTAVNDVQAYNARLAASPAAHLTFPAAMAGAGPRVKVTLFRWTW